ncbi:transcriptional regulator [Desulfosarcina widdelii]|uniref:Transcriptional regulator n=1 Tax=Desulfosarcina widdelii TaxID=947919 RepID=A0A5K7Z0C9_9BACT|nr:helix-turn-helix transcriptional regulator [Desulfosarcina widdelii]BBO74348.1 transcriptional regulator [Desulfosarcina widdelii]
MTHKTLGKDGLPLAVKQKLTEVGQQIRLARKRRKMTMQDLAGRMFVTRKTLGRLESGDPGVSLGVLAAALLALGLENDLTRLAGPEDDTVGNILDRERHEKTRRIRPASGKVDLNF